MGGDTVLNCLIWQTTVPSLELNVLCQPVTGLSKIRFIIECGDSNIQLFDYK